MTEVRVLQVEDNPADARLVVEMLREARGIHFRVETAATLHEAIERLRSSSQDVLLLDLGLPDAQGLEAVQRLSQEAERVPLIILSGVSDEQVVAKAAEVGAQDYLVKGKFDAEILVRAIRYALERKRAERALRESEERYRRVADAASDSIIAIDGEGRIALANRATERMFGYSQTELIGQPVGVLMPQDLRERHKRGFEHYVATGERRLNWDRVEQIGLRKDGEQFPIEISYGEFQLEGRRHIVGITRDVTERRRAETRILQLNRVYALLSDVNQAIVRVREPQALFDEACRIAVENGGFRMAWVGLLDAKSNTVRPVAHTGTTDGYLEKLQIVPGEGPRGLGPTGSALLEGRHDVSNDIEHDPRMAPWRDDALALGFRASAAFPLTVNGKTVGAFNLYSGEPGFFDEEELRLLDELALDLSFAMEMAQTEGERLRLATAIEQAPVSVVVTDGGGRIEYVNPAFTRITGYAPEEAVGGNPRMLKSGKHESALYVDLWATIKAGKAWRGELVNQRKDGSLYTAETTIAPVREAAGTTRFVAIAQDVTASRRADERMRLQAAALGAADNAVMITDREGKIAWVNPAFSRLTGWSEEECRGRTPRILKSGGHDRQFYDDLWRTILGGDVWRREMINRRKGGEPYIEDQTITPVRDRAGEITHFVAIKIDIGEHKRAEKALQHSEARYRALFEQSPDGVVLIDADTGKTIEANEAASKQLGYTREEFAGLRISDYEASESPEEAQGHMRKVIAEGSDDFETTQRARNGEIRNVHVWAKGIRLDGRLAFHCIFEDTTERKRTEASLRASEERYRTLFDRNLAGVYRTTLGGRILECNEAFARIFGYASREDALRASTDTLYATPADREIFVSSLQAEGVIVNHEFNGRRRDGQGLWLLENAHLVAGEKPGDGEVIEGTLLDVTERKRAEEAQFASLQEKEALLKEVHHRVKNNLQIITSLLRIEARKAAHDVTKSVLTQMQDRIQSMALLHETLYRSGNFARVDLSSYLSQLSNQLFRSLAIETGTIQLNLDLAPVKLEIDRAIPCGLIVNELISNALKHGFPDGRTGELWVRLLPTDDGRSLTLSVSDNGVGLPQDFDSKRQRSLGVQLVSDLARQLQGSLKIGPGPQAVFEVTFAVARTAEIPRPR